MKVKVTDLKGLVRQAVLKYGYTEAEAEVIVEILLYAQLRGNNQGIVKLIGRGIPKDEQAGEIATVKETEISALLDGNHNMGMLVMKKATELAIKKARSKGFGMVGTRNTSSSTGAIGYYVKQIADVGLIGFAFSGSPPSVAHYGSYEAKYGTNPIAIGIPTEEEPIVLDMATAAMAYYGLIEAKTAGQSIPDDVAYDVEGNPTTDPAKAMEGAIRSFDRSYKGAGLAMMIEVFTGPLVGASFVGLGDRGDWGNLVYAIDPSLLVSKEDFRKNTSRLVDTIKGSKKLPGFEEVLVPGERGNRLTQQRLDSGEIEVEDNLYQELKNVVG